MSQYSKSDFAILAIFFTFLHSSKSKTGISYFSCLLNTAPGVSICPYKPTCMLGEMIPGKLKAGKQLCRYDKIIQMPNFS